MLKILWNASEMKNVPIQYKHDFRQNKQKVTKRKITTYLTFEPSNWLVMLMDQIYFKNELLPAIYYPKTCSKIWS